MSQSLTGVISKIIGDRTISVIVSRRVPHPMFEKIVKINKKYLVDKTSGFTVKLWDSVEIKKIKPVSKRKAWGVVVI